MKKSLLSCLLLIALFLAACTPVATPEKPGYTVTYSYHLPGTVEAPRQYVVTVSPGGYAENLSQPGDDRYDFAGWYCNGEAFDFNTPIRQNIFLEAHFSPRAYDIHYTVNHEVRVEAVFYYGEKLGDPYVHNPSRLAELEEWQAKLDAGLYFVGWSENGTDLWDFETGIVTGDMTLEAVFLPRNAMNEE